MRLFTSLKSEINRTVLFGIMNVGDAHSESGCLFNTPISSNLATSFLRISKWIRGIGNSLSWNGVAPGFNCKWIGSASQSSKVPSKSVSYSLSNFKDLSAVTSIGDYSCLPQLGAGLLFCIWRPKFSQYGHSRPWYC